MKYGIEIDDSVNRILAFDLIDVLRVIEPWQRCYSWHVLDLEVIGPLPNGEDVRVLEQQVRANPAGISFTTKELYEFADSISQTIFGVFVATTSSLIRKKVGDGELYRAYEIVVEAFDSTYWRVVSDNIDLIQALRQRFEKTRAIRGFEFPEKT